MKTGWKKNKKKKLAMISQPAIDKPLPPFNGKSDDKIAGEAEFQQLVISSEGKR